MTNAEVTNKQNEVDVDVLIEVLSKKFDTEVISASYEVTQLHGGTLGNVRRLTGVAETKEEQVAYDLVLKIQNKWERFADPDSWRREYDLYMSELDGLFTEELRWPECYRAELVDQKVHLWLEHIEGVSGLEMNVDMYVKASEALGRFQGRLYRMHTDELKKLTNLSESDYIKKFYHHYRSWPEVYDYIRSSDCQIPEHICDMLIDMDECSEVLWQQIEQLPLVLSHRDFWVTNIFCDGEAVRLIDWDTTGWGYLGEDIASLIADEAQIDYMLECYERCIPAYYDGFSEYVDISGISDDLIREQMLFMFGYRLVEGFKFSEDQAEKELNLNTLQKIYEMVE